MIDGIIHELVAKHDLYGVSFAYRAGEFRLDLMAPDYNIGTGIAPTFNEAVERALEELNALRGKVVKIHG